jgi:hypothetical protein
MNELISLGLDEPATYRSAAYRQGYNDSRRLLGAGSSELSLAEYLPPEEQEKDYPAGWVQAREDFNQAREESERSRVNATF